MSQSIVGRWISANGSKAFLDFGDDGSLRGSDGANGIASTWQSAGAGAVIESFVSTQRAAPGMERWVARSHRVEADGDRLAVFDHSGEHIGDLTRDTAEATTTAPETTPDRDR